MYRIDVTYTAADEKTIREFYEAVRKAGIAETTRKEEGNLGYEYYFSADRGNELFLVEKWQDRESQQMHSQRPHLAELRDLKKKYDVRSEIEETV